ncbi:MAG: hypothetical protein ACPGYV_12075 [Phycisphaeraceae bacterium]
MVCPVKIDSVRPLVRYVDDHQAVIDTHLVTHAALPIDRAHRTADAPIAYVMAEIDGADGFHDEGCGRLLLKSNGSQMEGGFRFGIDEPRRWWPAGLGDQPLYELTVRLIVGDEVTDETKLSIGLASVRRGRVLGESLPPSLLVNGRICEVVEVLTVDRTDEDQLLPANGESLLLVRDHYGADLLYQAADMAGILAVQAVPIDPEGDPTAQVREQVDRLTAHPSLAGYYTGHLGKIKDKVDACLRKLDPTRTVFDHLPLPGLA